MTDEIIEIDLDDPRFRIKPYQQMLASCTGALVTSIFGKCLFHSFYLYTLFLLFHLYFLQEDF